MNLATTPPWPSVDLEQRTTPSPSMHTCHKAIDMLIKMRDPNSTTTSTKITRCYIQHTCWHWHQQLAEQPKLQRKRVQVLLEEDYGPGHVRTRLPEKKSLLVVCRSSILPWTACSRSLATWLWFWFTLAGFSCSIQSTRYWNFPLFGFPSGK